MKKTLLFLCTFLFLYETLAQKPFYVHAPSHLPRTALDLTMVPAIETKSHHHEHICQDTLYTHDGLAIPITFYNRNSDTIIVLGQGLRSPKEAMREYASLLNHCDVILFDYRWNGMYSYSVLKGLIQCSPIKQILLDEVQEVKTVLHFIQQKKQYKKVIGLGTCYSTFLFAKLQAEETEQKGKGPFTHLILDSCLHSLQSFAQQVCVDPYLTINPRHGGAPLLLRLLTNNYFIKHLFVGLIFTLARNVTIEPYIQKLTIPILFIHGQEDKLVTQEHFNKIFAVAPPHLTAVLFTPFNHCNNISNKAVHHYILNHFIGSDSIATFITQCSPLLSAI